MLKNLFILRLMGQLKFCWPGNQILLQLVPLDYLIIQVAVEHLIYLMHLHH